MARLAAAVALSGLVASSLAQQPLINVRQPWPYNGPEQVDTSNGDRGAMQGYNRCNSTTQNQNSLCVNAVMNSIADFCVWGTSVPGQTVGENEGEMVAYCTKSGYGTRLIPAGAIQGALFVRTPSYVAIGINIDQTQIGIAAGDTGGELDPHGADNRGNPIGSLAYSNAFTNGQTVQQVIEWHSFEGSNTVCQKFCNPNVPYANLCLNTLDTLGCTVNVPLPYDSIGTTFRSCLGDDQAVPNPNIGVPAISSCTTYQSTQLFSMTVTASSAAASSSGVSSGSSSAPITSVASMSTSTSTVTTTRPATASSTGMSASVSSRAGAAFPTATAFVRPAVALAAAAAAMAAL